jgi:hypothetical protein
MHLRVIWKRVDFYLPSGVHLKRWSRTYMCNRFWDLRPRFYKFWTCWDFVGSAVWAFV